MKKDRQSDPFHVFFFLGFLLLFCKDQLFSPSQPQVVPLLLKGLASKRGSNLESLDSLDSSQGQLSCSCILRDGPFDLPDPSQPQFWFLPPQFPPPKRVFPFCPQKSNNSMIQQQFIVFHLLFLSYHILCGKKGMVPNAILSEGFFF